MKAYLAGVLVVLTLVSAAFVSQRNRAYRAAVEEQAAAAAAMVAEGRSATDAGVRADEVVVAGLVAAAGTFTDPGFNATGMIRLYDSGLQAAPFVRVVDIATTGGDHIKAVASDAAGNIYVAGDTWAAGGTDAFVLKLSPDLSASLGYATIDFGGWSDYWESLAIDPAGLLEAHAEHPLGRLVVEDERACRVEHQYRHEEITRQLANQDHLHGLLRCFWAHYQLNVITAPESSASSAGRSFAPGARRTPARTESPAGSTPSSRRTPPSR